MLIALYAALAMVVQDILGVCMVQAEARNRGLLAGIFDSLMWLATITTTTLSVTTLQGSNTRDKVVVVVAVTAANLLGSITGVIIGKRFIKEKL